MIDKSLVSAHFRKERGQYLCGELRSLSVGCESVLCETVVEHVDDCHERGGVRGLRGTAGSTGSQLFLLFCKVTSPDKPDCDLMTKLLKEFKHRRGRRLHHQPISLRRRYFSSRRERPINIKQHKRVLNGPFIQCWKLLMCHTYSIRKSLVLVVCVMDDVLARTRCANQGIH